MTETSLGQLAFIGFAVFATVVGTLSFTRLPITIIRRMSRPALVLRPSAAKLAVPFAVTILLVFAASCDADKQALLLTGGPPQIPHSLEGREGQCLMCHESGVAGAPKAPANHAGRTSDVCPLCHIPTAASAHSAGVSVAAQPAVTAAPSPAAKATTAPAGGPPQIPHSLKGREGQCLMCHESGVAGAPKVPANHAGRTSDICTGCHQPAEPGG